MKIAIIDYGMGNLFSVQQAIQKLGVEVFISSDKEQLRQADAYVLPGVGAFEDAMKSLRQSELIDVIDEAFIQEKPLLAICLGMQLLFETSEENGQHEGLGYFAGHIRQFNRAQLRVPHMGWNDLNFTEHAPKWLLPSAAKDQYVYFVHSYYATKLQPEQLIAYAEYGAVQVPGIVKNGPFLAMQFHPEKSGDCGMNLLRSWLTAVQKEEAIR